MLTCDRAFTLLLSLEKGDLGQAGVPPATLAAELAELEKTGLVVSANPGALQFHRTIEWVCSEVEVGRRPGDEASTISELHQHLSKLEAELKSEAHRSFTSAGVLEKEHEKCVRLRGALSLLCSHWLPPELARASALVAALPPRGSPISVQGLPDVYSITRRGADALRRLNVRFTGKPLFEFLKGFNKSQQAMEAFVRDVRVIQQGIGPVPKMKEQVIIGLLKSGKPAPQAVGAFQVALGQLGYQSQDPKGKMRPHRAVAAVRNENLGSPRSLEQRLSDMGRALVQAGLRPDPSLEGAAKSLLPFPPQEGLSRFVEIFRRLQPHVRTLPDIYRMTARLMSAPGTPDEIARRVQAASSYLGAAGGPSWGGVTMNAAALACTVSTLQDVNPLCDKYLGIVRGLTEQRLCSGQDAAVVALDALSARGTPQEIVVLIQKLAMNISGDRPGLDDIKIAAAFAKRFAF